VEESGEQSPVCTWCTCYASPWGLEHREGLEALLQAREAARGVLPRDADGRVCDLGALDLILVAVILPNRIRERKVGSR